MPAAAIAGSVGTSAAPPRPKQVFVVRPDRRREPKDVRTDPPRRASSERAGHPHLRLSVGARREDRHAPLFERRVGADHRAEGAGRRARPRVLQVHASERHRDGARMPGGGRRRRAATTRSSRAIDTEGATRWMRVRTFPVRDASGEIYRVVGHRRGRDRVEARGRGASQQRPAVSVADRALLRSHSSASTRAGRFTYLSPSFEVTLGLPSQDWINRSGFDLVWPDDLDTARALLGPRTREPGARPRRGNCVCGTPTARSDGWRARAPITSPIRPSRRSWSIAATSPNGSGWRRSSSSRRRWSRSAGSPAAWRTTSTTCSRPSRATCRWP